MHILHIQAPLLKPSVATWNITFIYGRGFASNLELPKKYCIASPAYLDFFFVRTKTTLSEQGIIFPGFIVI